MAPIWFFLLPALLVMIPAATLALNVYYLVAWLIERRL